jgi:hypothetical protein
MGIVNYTALMHAGCKKMGIHILSKTILEKRNTDVNYANNSGCTSLIIPSKNGNIPIVATLLEQKIHYCKPYK